jgi:FAD:protein FMN transferase
VRRAGGGIRRTCREGAARSSHLDVDDDDDDDEHCRAHRNGGCREGDGPCTRAGAERCITRRSRRSRSTTCADAVAARGRQRGNVSISFRALGTTAVIATVDPALEGEACAAGAGELDAIDRACSRFRPDSELTRVNDARGRRVSVGPLLLEALQVALGAARASDGLVDPTVGKTLRTLGYDSTFHVVAMRDADSFRASFSTVPGWQCVEIDVAASTVRVPAGVELDLGATAKALACDRVAAAAAAVAGGTLVGLGGDIAVAGEAPTGGWAVRIADDHAAPLDAAGPTVAVQSGGLATSSTTVRRWRSGKVELHHLVDPRTGRPARSRWRTITVAAKSCVDANVASTAAFLLPDSASWLEERGLPARLVSIAGETTFVAGWPADAS